MTESEAPQGNAKGTKDVSDRLAAPLLIPVVVFLFAVLVIYGLSRVYLELNDIKIGDVTMATPLAIGVSLFILGSAWYLAGNRRVPLWQTALIATIAVAALSGGAIWAAVDDRGEGEANLVEAEPTPTVIAGAGEVLVGLTESGWLVSPSPDTAPAGEVTFVVTNEGQLPHNLRVIKTDLAPDKLPLAADGLGVDESQLDILISAPDVAAGGSEDATASLEAGSYVLICNVAGHYQAGMHTAFTVQ